MAPTVMALGAEADEMLEAYCSTVVSPVDSLAYGCTHGIVSSSYNWDWDHVGLAEAFNGMVHNLGISRAQRHIHDAAALLAPLLYIMKNKFHSPEDAGLGTLVICIENFDSHKLRFLGNAVGRATSRAGNMISMAGFVIVLVRMSACSGYCQAVPSAGIYSRLGPQSWRPRQHVP